jgi:hypothetical protein
MKKYVFLLALCTFTQALLAQGGDNQGVPKEFLGNFERNLPKENPDKNIRGTRYSTEDYCAGELVMKNGNHYTTELLYKFDEFSNAIQVKFGNGKEVALFYNNIDSFRLFIGKNVVNYIKADVPNESETNKFYQVIYLSTNYQLIKLPKKVVVNVDTRNAFGDGEEFKKFENKDIYFLKKGSAKPFEKIKISKKALIELLPTKKETLTKLFDTPSYKGLLDDAKLAALFKEIDL